MLSLLAQVVVAVEVVTVEVALEVALETFHVSSLCHLRMYHDGIIHQQVWYICCHGLEPIG